MFYKGFGSKKPVEQEMAGQSSAESGPISSSPGKLGTIDVFLNSSGRVSLQILERLAETYSQSDFTRLLRQPVLAGSSIQAGSLALRRGERNNEINKTFVFEIDSSEEAATISEVLKHAIYPLMKEPDSGRARNIFTIGRITGNDLIIPDIAISKRHAILEVNQDRYSIRDCHSTNGTLVNGTRVGEKAHPVRDGDIISFARYEFTFLAPDSLYKRLTES